MAKKSTDIIVQPGLMHEFQEVYGLIQSHRKRVAAAVDNEALMMLWEVGGYVSMKLKSSAWGDGVVRQLSEYIRTQDPTVRGWGYRTIYRMVKFYDTYSCPDFIALVNKMKVNGVTHPQLISDDKEFVPIEMVQMATSKIVPIELSQIPNVLFAKGGWRYPALLGRILPVCK